MYEGNYHLYALSNLSAWFSCYYRDYGQGKLWRLFLFGQESPVSIITSSIILLLILFFRREQNPCQLCILECATRKRASLSMETCRRRRRRVDAKKSQYSREAAAVSFAKPWSQSKPRVPANAKLFQDKQAKFPHTLGETIGWSVSSGKSFLDSGLFVCFGRSFTRFMVP